MPYRVLLTPAAARDLRRLPPDAAPQIVARLQDLANDPRPLGSTSLQGQRGLLRVREAEYRVVYRIDDARQEVEVLLIDHRRQVYRRLRNLPSG